MLDADCNCLEKLHHVSSDQDLRWNYQVMENMQLFFWETNTELLSKSILEIVGNVDRLYSTKKLFEFFFTNKLITYKSNANVVLYKSLILS